MKINIITYNNNYGLSQDVNILIHQLKRHFRDRIEVFAVNFFDYKCNYVDLNIFLETVSYALFKYAPVNILIPNQEWYYRTWIPYINHFDNILVKTNYGENIFRQLVDDSKKIINIGWQSRDKYSSKIKKNYKKFVHVCGKSKHKQTQAIVDNWLPNFPEITILYSPKDVPIIEKTQDNIKYLRDRISEEELTQLLNESGVHICCSDTEGFGHYIQEAKSCQAVVVTLDAPPMNNFINNNNGFLVKPKSKKPLKNVLGSKYLLDGEDFQKIISKIAKADIGELKQKGIEARNSYLQTCRTFRDSIKDNFRDIFEKATRLNKIRIDNLEKEKEEKNEMAKDENLPKVSIITPTYNRPHMFRIALYNYINFNYPREKLQWIIIDDSDEDKRIGDMIPDEEGVDIKYISVDRQLTIGQKRNMCIEEADHDIIVCMDDDDYYPPNSIKLRVLELLYSKKQCVTCTTIACFHINKLISMINVPPHRLSFSERISEATLCFYKSFWEKQKFPERCHIGEAKEFLDGRHNETHEISWEGIIVSLMHNRNVSGKITMGDVPNGCHYGWNDKLYLFITNLDIEITQEEEDRIIKARKGGVKYDPNYQIVERRLIGQSKEIKNTKENIEENIKESIKENKHDKEVETPLVA